MNKCNYKKLVEQLSNKAFRVTVPAQDEAEPHLEEMMVISYNDVLDILWKNLRKRGK